MPPGELGVLKGDGSPVTVADFSVQAVTGFFLSEYSGSETLVAEETSDFLARPEGKAIWDHVVRYVKRILPEATGQQVCEWIDAGRSTPAERYWTLDPIDGTSGYLRGQQYAVALSLIVRGEVRLSVLGCPCLRDGCYPDVSGNSVVFAVRGGGAWVTSLDLGEPLRPLKVSGVEDFSQARVLYSVETDHNDRVTTDKVLKRCGVRWQPTALDSMAKYAVLAGGQAEFFCYLPTKRRADNFGLKVWDIAPGALVVEEAGGRITDLAGNAPHYENIRVPLWGGVVISNGRLHDRLLTAFKLESQ
jgi:3'(2'), 5'-bisphosphate nucleotidase